MSWDRTCYMSTTSSSIDSGGSSIFSPSSLPRDYDVVLPSSSIFFFSSSDYIDDQSTGEQHEENKILSAPLTLPLLHHYHLHPSNYSTRPVSSGTCSCHHTNHLCTPLTNNELNSTFVYEQYLTSFKSEQSEYLPYLFDNVVYPQPCSPPSPTNDSITYYQLDQVHSSPLINKIPTCSQHLARTIQPIIYQQLSSIEPASSNSQQRLPIVKRYYYDSTMSTTTMTSTTPVPTIINGNDSTSLPYARLDSSSFGTYNICREKTVVGRTNTHRSVDVNIDATSVVSRIHFEILLINGNEFHLKCLSKNGIFINNHYISMSVTNVLPKQCTLRFPSTNLCIAFSSLLTSMNNNERLSTDSFQHQRLSSSIEIENNQSLSPTASSQQQVIFVATNSTSNFNDRPPLSIQISSLSSPSTGSSFSTGNSSSHLTSIEEIPTSTHQGVSPVICPKQEPVEMTSTTLIFSSTNCESNGFELDNDSSKLNLKPPFSYAQLIVQAISSAPDKQMTLSQIYNFISGQYPYYESNNRGWQNSIRHNLSLNRYFIRSARKENDSGKGSFWRLDQKCEEKLIDHAFHHRKQRTNLSTISSFVHIKPDFDNESGDFLLADLHMSNPSTPISPTSNDERKRKRVDDDEENRRQTQN